MNLKAPILAASLVAAVAPLLPAADTSIASLTSKGAQTQTGYFDETAISGNGRFVAFDGDATDFVPGDTNGLFDVFVRDRKTGKSTRVSVASSGAEAIGGASYAPALSSNGRFVAFESSANNLVPNDTNGQEDVFVHDRKNGTTTRVSVDSNGAEAIGSSSGASISGDGRYVAFQSTASNLVDDDTNNSADVFVHDRKTGKTTRVSVDSLGNQSSGHGQSGKISGTGRFVVFTSSAGDLVSDDSNAIRDIFVHDRKTGVTERVSVDSLGAQVAAGDITDPSISANGRIVAFMSSASTLVPNDSNATYDIFTHDRKTGITTRVSVDSNGAEGDSNGSYDPSLSKSGRFVVFEGHSTNLVPDDTNGAGDIFVHNRKTGKTERVSLTSNGTQSTGNVYYPSISGSGRFVVFGSEATDLVPSDTNGQIDIFIRDRN